MQLPIENVMMRHRNPGATQDLVIPVHIICNTPDEVLIKNITENSRQQGNWLRASDPHDGVAVLCGGGPSLADTLDDIKWQVASGAKVFAMNGAAKFLADNGVMPDYQVICDARKDNVELIGPAKHHLFASQCDPLMFESEPNAQLWHLQIGGIEDYFPQYDKSYVLIGGAASVGNTATCLAYAMGYRNLQIYGYDSSHRDGAGHAYRQPLNDGDPCASVTFNGKKYIASLTMRHQAEKFQDTARALQESGCRIEVHGSGLLPDMWNTPVEQLTEQEKYQRMWAYSAYRTVSPGEECVDIFLEVCKPDGLVIDFGCGTGRAAMKIKDYGCFVQLIDFTDNSRDPECMTLPFRQHDLTEPLHMMAKYGYCTDVMEHIDPENVNKVIDNIMAVVKTAFFQISTVPDVMGAVIGQQLHLTVRPHRWWKDTFTSLGYEIQWEKEQDIASIFVVKRKSF